MNVYDKTKPHQIQLVVVSRGSFCMDGSVVRPQQIAVTCNCHRIGSSEKYQKMIAALPTEGGIPHAWRMWNMRSHHSDQETFQPNEKMVERYGVLTQVLSD